MTRTSSRFSDYADRPNRAALHYLEKDGTFRSRYVRWLIRSHPQAGLTPALAILPNGYVSSCRRRVQR